MKVKITKEIVRDGALIGIGVGLVVNGLNYLINKKYVKDVDDIERGYNEWVIRDIEKCETELTILALTKDEIIDIEPDEE